MAGVAGGLCCRGKRRAIGGVPEFGFGERLPKGLDRLFHQARELCRCHPTLTPEPGCFDSRAADPAMKRAPGSHHPGLCFVGR